jgi:hypothetical protein
MTSVCAKAKARSFLALHQKAMTAQAARHERETANWYAASERSFGADLPHMVDTIKGAVGNNADAARFYQLLEWSGLAVEPSVLRVLHKLAGRY